MMVRAAVLIGVLVLCNVVKVVASEQYCINNTPPTTPSERFKVDVDNETVLDTKTGLMWKLCVEGRSGIDCNGVFTKMGWFGAYETALRSNHAGYDDWRLPDANELEDIVERSCSNPAINLAVFPGSPSSDVWTSSAFARPIGRLLRYWYVDFRLGTMKSDSRSDNNAVRLVRDARDINSGRVMSNN